MSNRTEVPLVPSTTSPLTLRVQRLRPDALVPRVATEGSAGYDLFWCPREQPVGGTTRLATIDETKILETGVAFGIPPGLVGLVFSRSGHGFKYGVRLANCVGVIDSDYRGEVMVKLVRDYSFGGGVLEFSPGDRIAQIMFVQYSLQQLCEVAELDQTVRGTSGFGSTGA